MNTNVTEPQVIELNQDLLGKPFQTLTKWNVITGAPCSGKTTLINILANRGYSIIPETGRSYVESEIEKGKTLAEIRHDIIFFNIVIKDIQINNEQKLNPLDDYFLDRALPDCLAYYQLAGMDPNEILSECFYHRYASVFILERFPVRRDTARIEDETSAQFLDKWIYQDYRALGYRVVKVPVLPPEERVNYVLNHISGL